jgi:hypothetical protein
MTQGDNKPLARQSHAIWSGKPAVGSYIIIYGVLAMIIILVLVTAEYLSGLFPNSATTGKAGVVVPYPIEIGTTIIIALIFLAKLVQLAILWATNRYELMPDGLYVNHGIINLENQFLSPIAFSDARLIRTLALRIVHRGLIIIDANDGRHFYLRYIKNPLEVQSLIRRTLAHPTVKTE